MIKSNILTNKSRIKPILLKSSFIWLSLAILITGFSSTNAQNPEKLIREGNKLYKDSLFSKAEAKFAEALEADPNYNKGIFNQGNALFKQQKFEEALQNYELSAGLMDDPAEKSAAYHNLGNTFFESKQFDKSVEAYKNALRSNPNDSDTKYNLMVAKKMLEQQQKQDQDQDQQNENQDQKQQDQNSENQEDQEGDNQDQQDGDSQNDPGDEKDDQGKKGNEGKDEKDESQKQPAMVPSKLSPEEVQRILEALSNDEKQTIKELMKKEAKTKPNKSDKDW